MRESTAEFRAHQPVLTARSAARSALDCRAGPRALINMEGSAFEASRGAHPSLLPTIPATLRPSLPSKKLLHSPVSLSLSFKQKPSRSPFLPKKSSSFSLSLILSSKKKLFSSFLSRHEGETLSLSHSPFLPKNHLSLLSFLPSPFHFISFLSKRVFLPFFTALRHISFSLFFPLSLTLSSKKLSSLFSSATSLFRSCTNPFSLSLSATLSSNYPSHVAPFSSLPDPLFSLVHSLPSLSIHPFSLSLSLMTVEGTVEEGVESERSWGVGTVGSAQ